LALELGGQAKVDDMLQAKGVSLILKSIEVQFKRPVTYPDTVRPPNLMTRILVSFNSHFTTSS
jgi:acyl-CoA thioesterase FadM